MQTTFLEWFIQPYVVLCDRWWKHENWRTLCDAGRAQSSSELPLIKIWCAGHRINLVWKSLTQEVLEIGKILKDASSLSSYFHMSAVNTRTLKKIAEDNSYQFVYHPSNFEVRWTQFSYCSRAFWKIGEHQQNIIKNAPQIMKQEGSWLCGQTRTLSI